MLSTLSASGRREADHARASRQISPLIFTSLFYFSNFRESVGCLFRTCRTDRSETRIYAVFLPSETPFYSWKWLLKLHLILFRTACRYSLDHLREFFIDSVCSFEKVTATKLRSINLPRRSFLLLERSIRIDPVHFFFFFLFESFGEKFVGEEVQHKPPTDELPYEVSYLSRFVALVRVGGGTQAWSAATMLATGAFCRQLGMLLMTLKVVLLQRVRL